jgi:hypothetical protein
MSTHMLEKNSKREMRKNEATGDAQGKERHR